MAWCEGLQEQWGDSLISARTRYWRSFCTSLPLSFQHIFLYSVMGYWVWANHISALPSGSQWDPAPGEPQGSLQNWGRKKLVLPVYFLFLSQPSQLDHSAPFLPVVALIPVFSFFRNHTTSLTIPTRRPKPQLASAPSSDKEPSHPHFWAQKLAPAKQCPPRSVPSRRDCTSKPLNFNNPNLFPLFLQPYGW